MVLSSIFPIPPILSNLHKVRRKKCSFNIPSLEFEGLQAGKNVTLVNYLPSVEELETPIEEGFHVGEPRNEIGVAGDERAAENAALTAIHVLFSREHNRLVDELSAQHPTWNDSQLFEKARVINIAQLQHITYTEYLPTLFGHLQTFLYLGPYFCDLISLSHT